MKRKSIDRAHNRDDASERRVQDPVCEMTIPVGQAVASIEHGGQRYYFCSEGCVDLFNKDPNAYTDPQRIYERNNTLMLHHLHERECAAEQHAQDAAAHVSQVRDPVCAAMIDPDRAPASIRYEEKVYYFCHQECADRFQQNPGVYANPGRGNYTGRIR